MVVTFRPHVITQMEPVSYARKFFPTIGCPSLTWSPHMGIPRICDERDKYLKHKHTLIIDIKSLHKNF